ncbi:MAG: hypothetical protein K9G03_02455 [Pontimonas sp.]|nr:hypothetical protein [Pontimonas sp.]
MSPRARVFAPFALASAVVLGLSGCSVLEDWGVLNSAESTAEDAAPSEEEPTTGSDATPESEGEEAAAEVVDEGLSVPTCDTMYSPELSATLLEELRTNVGDTSEGDFGYGTTDPDLVPLLKNVRSDLKISCTWYLPASESVSVTSVAIVGGDVLRDVTSVLRTAGAGSAEAGGGTLYTFDSTTSDESPDYIATEAHFLVDIPCPASLAEESCGAWVSTNYAFGKAQPLTLDAARTLGVYTN